MYFFGLKSSLTTPRPARLPHSNYSKGGNQAEGAGKAGIAEPQVLGCWGWAEGPWAAPGEVQVEQQESLSWRVNAMQWGCPRGQGVSALGGFSSQDTADPKLALATSHGPNSSPPKVPLTQHFHDHKGNRCKRRWMQDWPQKYDQRVQDECTIDHKNMTSRYRKEAALK